MKRDTNSSKRDDAGWDYLSVSIAVGQFSCLISNPCTYDNIITYGYYFPHYVRENYIQCGIWDSAAQFSSCSELTCQPAGTVYDDTTGVCDFVGQRKCCLPAIAFQFKENKKNKKAPYHGLYGSTSCCITGSALALHCCKAHAKINRKVENLTPCKFVTDKDFNLKLGTRDNVADITHHATLESNRPSGGSPTNKGNMTPVILFFPRSRAQVEPSHWLLRWMAQMTCFRPRKCLFGGQDDGWRHMGKIFPKNSPKRVVNRQFQAIFTSQYLRNY